MKFPGIFFFLFLIIHSGFSQTQSGIQPISRKGNIYIYWGWNRAWYSTSDIHFKGENFDFTLRDVESHDKPSSNINNYINPFNATIPQTDFRIGFFIHNHYSISAGFDHMKYVVSQYQVTRISGVISSTETPYDKTYLNDDITISRDFLEFEHTNGLNYINIDARRFDEILDLNKIKISLTEGIGAGILLPKTNTTLFNRNNNDQYHLSGYGISAVVAANISFFKYFFIQSEFKNGFINMPDIRIAPVKTAKASQSFLFTQFNIVLGANFRFGHKHDAVD
ncbi:MAG: hypothetical protein IPP15_14215 [Saprospiraceae bacterium]|uniref:Uncharacterized protein n=1 Tax=Candidatus Opimibacter skivensis TaxID=2982028 RepID=A0A9D7XTC3_9BACT|nr:hypothetical protein [Candidatus Opimibacter skivensis]